MKNHALAAALTLGALLLPVTGYAQARSDVVLTTETTTEYFEPLTPWMPSINTQTGAQAFLYLLDQTGNFEARLGVQTATTTTQVTATSAIGSDAGYVTAAGISSGKKYRFNPNDTADGNIDTAVWYRIGILYKLSASGAGSGTVRVEGLAHE